MIIVKGIVLTKTSFEKHIYALGGNEETVRLSDINL